MYQFLQSMRFEMYLFVILHFDSALGNGGGGGRVLPYIGYMGMSSVRGTCFFLDIFVKSRVSIWVILVSN